MPHDVVRRNAAARYARIFPTGVRGNDGVPGRAAARAGQLRPRADDDGAHDRVPGGDQRRRVGVDRRDRAAVYHDARRVPHLGRPAPCIPVRAGAERPGDGARGRREHGGGPGSDHDGGGDRNDLGVHDTDRDASPRGPPPGHQPADRVRGHNDLSVGRSLLLVPVHGRRPLGHRRLLRSHLVGRGWRRNDGRLSVLQLHHAHHRGLRQPGADGGPRAHARRARGTARTDLPRDGRRLARRGIRVGFPLPARRSQGRRRGYVERSGSEGDG